MRGGILAREAGGYFVIDGEGMLVHITIDEDSIETYPLPPEPTRTEIIRSYPTITRDASGDEYWLTYILYPDGNFIEAMMDVYWPPDRPEYTYAAGGRW